MATLGDSRGILYPARLPTFHREAAPPDLAGLVRWFWVPRWNIAPGRTSRQHVLPFPASNLVVVPEGLELSGPTTRASHRDLQGAGWAVGALLRPAGVACLHDDPQSIRDRDLPFDAPTLHADISAAMNDRDEAAGRARAVRVFADWLREHGEPPSGAALLANELEDVVAGDAGIITVEQLADRLNVSVRTLQRIARRYIGVPPKAVVRRYRLQEAAKRLRDDAAVSIAQVAADLGYADHAHFDLDFKAVFGHTPSAYRRGVGAGALGSSGAGPEDA